MGGHGTVERGWRVPSSDPIAGQVTAGYEADAGTELREVLDGTLRDPSAGGAGAALRATSRVGRGSA